MLESWNGSGLLTPLFAETNLASFCSDLLCAFSDRDQLISHISDTQLKLVNIDSTTFLQIQGIHTDRETGHPTLKKGKLNLVDLAGSERHGKTGAL